MTVNDLQSGLGIHHRNGGDSVDEEEMENINNSYPNSTNMSINSNSRLNYETKAEIRKREIKEKAQQPLNSLCNCGSNKKYKNCCIKKEL